jgi:hypothetical protein
MEFGRLDERRKDNATGAGRIEDNVRLGNSQISLNADNGR